MTAGFIRMSSGRRVMAAVARVRKSSLHNALEGLALTATLQSFPTFAAAAFLLKLVGNHDLVGDPGVAIFVGIASLAHALLAVPLGPSFPFFLKPVYEPKREARPEGHRK